MTDVASSHTSKLDKIILNLHKNRVRSLEFYIACSHQDGRCFFLFGTPSCKNILCIKGCILGFYTSD